MRSVTDRLRKSSPIALPLSSSISDFEADITPYGSVELWLRAASRSGVFRDLPAGVIRRQGCTDERMLLALCLLNILGWARVDDLDRMEADDGLFRLVRRHEGRIPGVLGRAL